jgi:hypothetical protein
MKTHRCFLYAILFGVLATVLSAPVDAAPSPKEKDLGTFGSWRAYAYDEGGQTVCYMVTTKTVQTKGPAKRTAPYLMITHRPVEASTDVFSYGAGALLDAKHGVKLEVGKTDFDLFSVRDTAWSRDALTDHKVAAALRNSARAQVVGISSQNRITPINDVFDLTGALQAYRVINKACGLADVESPQPIAKKAAAQKPVATKKPTPRKSAVKKTSAKKKAAKHLPAQKPVAAQANPSN